MKRELELLDLEPTELTEEELLQLEKEFWEINKKDAQLAFIKFVGALLFIGVGIFSLIMFLRS